VKNLALVQVKNNLYMENKWVAFYGDTTNIRTNMWMTLYVNEIKRQFIDHYGFPENPDQPGCVLGDVPDGDYPMTIDGKSVVIYIKQGMINLSDSKGPPSTLRSV